jgi:hypothetical protein
MTNIFGRGKKFFKLAKKFNAPVKKFTGGYDDYDGSLSWATIPVSLKNPTVRFSPDPSNWMDGVRIYDNTRLMTSPARYNDIVL